MDLSSMYGITLPVLLFSLQKEEVVNLIKSVDSKFNSFIIEDFSKSLNYMQQIGELIRIGRGNETELSDKLKRTPIATLSDEEQLEVNNAIKLEVINEIAKLEIAGNVLNSNFTLDKFLTEVNKVSFVKARRSIKDLLPKNIVMQGNSKTFEYLTQYNLEIIIPEKINDIELTPLDKKIIKFYYLRLLEYSADIKKTLETISDLDSESVQMLLRRPRAMYYRVYDRLAPLQDVTTISVLTKTIDDLKANLEMQFDNINNTVNDNTFDPKIYVDKVISIFRVDSLNERFNESMQREEWESEFERLDNLCICGMNLITDRLYDKAIIDYTPKSGIVSDEHSLDEYKDVIVDIKTALDSLIPYNTPIT